VPLIEAYPLATRFPEGATPSRYVPGGKGPTMCRPGSTISGLPNPSTVVPRELQLSRVSSFGPLVSIVSNAPAAKASGSLAGA
jgi:hypothetical protein